MGGCQNYDHFLGTLNTGCRTIIGIQKGTIILTTNRILNPEQAYRRRGLGKKLLNLVEAFCRTEVDSWVLKREIDKVNVVSDYC